MHWEMTIALCKGHVLKMNLSRLHRQLSRATTSEVQKRNIKDTRNQRELMRHDYRVQRHNHSIKNRLKYQNQKCEKSSANICFHPTQEY